MNILIKEVDPHIASTLTLSISRKPLPEDMESSSLEDDQAMEFLTLGTQVGFDPGKLGKLWNALANLALHVSIPKDKSDTIPQYGDSDKIKEKILETLDEFKRLSAGNLVLSGVGEEISFECMCGARNKRRFALLRDGQTISCINPNCSESYDYEESTASFQRRAASIICKKCQSTQLVPTKMIERLRTDETIHFDCEGCDERIYIHWRPMQAQAQKPKP